MASPFSVFRKHQKVMLAAITILAMFAFVFISPWGRGNSGGAGGGGKALEVATWKYGSISQSDISSRLATRKIVNKFMADAIKAAGAKGAFSEKQPAVHGFPENPANVLDAIILHKKAEQLGLAVTDETVNQFINDQITDNKLNGEDLAAVIRNMSGSGMRLTQEYLVDALRWELEVMNLEELLYSDVASGSATPEQRFDHFSRLYRRATVQVLPVDVKDFVSKVPAPSDDVLRAFFEQYKEQYSLPDFPDPGFRVPTRVKVQYFQAKVEDFVAAEKPKVTDAEINEYYEKHKDSFRKPTDDSGTSADTTKKPEKSPPGDSTKSEQKTDKSSPDKTDKTGGKKPESDKNAQQGKEPAREGDKAGPSTEKPAAEKADSVKNAEKPAADKSADKPVGDKRTADKTPPVVPSPDKTPVGDKDAGKADSPPPADAKTPPAGKSAFDLLLPRQRATETLLALADTDPPAPPTVADKDAAINPKPADAKAADAKPGDSKPTDAKTGDAKPADAKSADAKPADAKSSDSKSADSSVAPPKTDSTTKPAESKPAAATKPIDAASPKPADPTAPVVPFPPTTSGDKATIPAATGNPELDLKGLDPLKKIPIVEYESKDDPKVREDIRTKIAREKANTQITAAFDGLRNSVAKYGNQVSSWKAKQEGTAPTPPDFAALAKEKGVEFHETGWVSALEARDKTEFGKSLVFSMGANNQPSQSSVLSQAFYKDVQSFKPYDSYGTDPESDYLWWRTDFKDTYVPKFEDVKNEVLAAWKMIKARDLAVAQAKEYAEEVRKQQSELKEVFKFRPELHVSKDIGPFTWMSRLSVARDYAQQAPLQLTQLKEVPQAGEEFFQTVFSLGAGKTGVAMNNPKTVAYVIQVKSLDPPEDIFRREFLRRMALGYDESFKIAGIEAQEALGAKKRAIGAEFDVKVLPEFNTAFASSGRGPSGPALPDGGDD